MDETKTITVKMNPQQVLKACSDWIAKEYGLVAGSGKFDIETTHQSHWPAGCDVRAVVKGIEIECQKA